MIPYTLLIEFGDFCSFINMLDVGLQLLVSANGWKEQKRDNSLFITSCCHGSSLWISCRCLFTNAMNFRRREEIVLWWWQDFPGNWTDRSIKINIDFPSITTEMSPEQSDDGGYKTRVCMCYISIRLPTLRTLF